MSNPYLADWRLHNQHLTGMPFDDPVDVVTWLGAVQSQDYAGGKWAVSIRTKGLDNAAIEQAINEGRIQRTHILRPTWHFVTPADIRWMLDLTAPRVKIALRSTDKRLELDEATIAKSQAIIEKALKGGKQLTRAEMEQALNAGGIVTRIEAEADVRLGHILYHAELDKLICNGLWRGKHSTHALFDERVPATKPLAREEAVGELAKRYFTSHGPATLKDYVWWSGLTMTDAKAGVAMNKPLLASEKIQDKEYWYATSMPAPAMNTIQKSAHLLPNYDEYIVAYVDRSAIYDSDHADKLDSRGNVLFNHTIVMDGMIVGTWKRTLRAYAVVFEWTLFRALDNAEQEALDKLAEQYGRFIGLPVNIAKG
jgi:hypothetical protein